MNLTKRLAILMTAFFGVGLGASAATLQMESHQQTNNLGQLATLFWDGSDGRPASTAQWSWDGVILSSTGTFSTIAHIGDRPFTPTIIGDDVLDLVINTAAMTVNATSYTCVEGTFLAFVGAYGCAQSGFGDNFINETSVTYNVGGDASHVKRTVGGDDILFNAPEPRGTKPRGLTTVAADPLGAWDATYGAFDFFTVAISGLNVGDTVLLSEGASAVEIAACRAAAVQGKPCDGAVGNGPDLRFAAWLEFKVVPTPAIRVQIDIKPNADETNPIAPSAKGKIPVVILTTADFDALTVDPTTLAFGPNGAAIAHSQAHPEDVNGDGDIDLLVHFRTQETGIACGDTEATLTGETFDGQPVEGSDTITTVGRGCK